MGYFSVILFNILQICLYFFRNDIFYTHIYAHIYIDRERDRKKAKKRERKKEGERGKTRTIYSFSVIADSTTFLRNCKLSDFKN